MPRDIPTPMTLPFTFTSGKMFVPGSRITFGSLDSFAAATGELRLVGSASLFNALTQSMGDLRLTRITPPDVEALADCADGLLGSSFMNEDREQVLYAFANVVTQVRGNPPLLSMAALQGTAPNTPVTTSMGRPHASHGRQNERGQATPQEARC